MRLFSVSVVFLHEQEQGLEVSRLRGVAFCCVGSYTCGVANYVLVQHSPLGILFGVFGGFGKFRLFIFILSVNCVNINLPTMACIVGTL